MSRLPSALALALAQLGDPRILRVLGKSLLITLAIFIALGWLGSFGFDALLARMNVDEGGALSGVLAAIATVIAAWLLFRLVALAVLQFFADEIVEAVEAKHYPAAATSARKLTFGEDMRNALSATARAVLVNMLALPLAVILLVTGVGTALLFWTVNAWLLGRELQDMVWLRHRLYGQARPPMSGGGRFLLGGIVAALLLVPFVNLLAPVLGAAAATHLIHRRRAATDAA